MKKTKAPVIIDPKAESLVIIDPKMEFVIRPSGRGRCPSTIHPAIFCINPFAVWPDNAADSFHNNVNPLAEGPASDNTDSKERL